MASRNVSFTPSLSILGGHCSLKLCRKQTASGDVVSFFSGEVMPLSLIPVIHIHLI